MANNLTTVAFIFKHNYSDDDVVDMAMRDHPYWSDITKEGGFGGDDYRYALQYGHDQAISGSFAKAQAQSANSSFKGFQPAAVRKPKYGIGRINGEAMRAAIGNKMAFLNLVTRAVDGMIKEVGSDHAFDLYRSGNGIRGRRLSISTNTITLTNQYDTMHFRIGMTIGASPNADGSSPRTGTAVVTSIDVDGSTITVDNAAGITSFANNDYLFRDGDPGTCKEGLEVCTPLTKPVFGSDSFRGFDRGTYAEILAGSRVNDTATSIEENMGLLAVKINMQGGKARRGHLNPLRFWQVARKGQAQVQYQKAGGQLEWGFETMMLSTPGGTLKVVSDPDCPMDRIRVGNPDSEYIKHLDGLPHVAQDDGKYDLRVSNADDIEFRIRSWDNYIQSEPRNFGAGAI